MSNTVPNFSAIRLLAAGAATLLLASTAATAPPWELVPRLAVGGEVDDNAQLTVRTDDVVKLEGYLLEAAAAISYESATTDFVITPLIFDRNYPDEEVFDSTMYDVQMRYTYRGQRNRFRFDAWFNEDDIRNAERADVDLDQQDPDDIPDDDTGLVQIPGDRTRIQARPSWTYSWSRASASTLRIDYRDVTYDAELGFTDYTDARFTLDYSNNFSTRSAWFVSGAVRNYDLEGDEGEFDSISFNVGLDTRLSETLRLRARIGAEDVESSTNGLNETQPIGELTFIRQLETIRLLAQYRRSVTTSGRGQMSERDAVNVRMTRVLNERFEAGLGLKAYRSRPIRLEPDQQLFDRNYAQLTARLTWNITRSISMEPMYRYTFVDREVQGESANSNQFILWFAYQPGGADQ